MNITDPIIPGKSAAGILLGDQIESIAGLHAHQPVERFHEIEKYTFEAVTIWVKNGLVEQVGVRAPYSGKLSSGIGIGSRIDDVQRTLGDVTEDEDDNLVVVNSSGWCFETEPWPTPIAGLNSESRISEIFVFACD